jgi:hypothetical protein
MKIKTNQLTGDALDWAVAKCAELPFPFAYDDYGREYPVSPSTLWIQGGPIIEREEISISRECASGRIEWAAWTPAPIRDDAEAFGYGPTPLIAAMRCYVASRFGDEVDVPDELVK